MLSKWLGETEHPRQVRKGGSKRHSIRAKQNKEKKYRVHCSALVVFFRLVWGFVLHKQPREGLRFSREFQPRYRNKFENHSDRGRCDFVQQAPTFLFHLSHLQPFPLQGKKKKVCIEVIIPAGQPAAGKAVSTPGRGSQHTSLHFFLNTKTTHGLRSPSICHWKLAK